ncbi:MAG: hypothetical protein ACK559_16440 [bacterium]
MLRVLAVPLQEGHARDQAALRVVLRGVEDDADIVPAGHAGPISLGDALGLEHVAEEEVVGVEVDHAQLVEHQLLSGRAAQPELVPAIHVEERGGVLKQLHH